MKPKPSFTGLILLRRALNNTYVGPFIHGFVSVNIYSTVNVFVLPCDFLNIFISLTNFILRTRSVIHVICEIYVN